MFQHNHFPFRKCPITAAGQVFFGQAAVKNAVEPFDLVAQMLENTPNDAVFADMNFNHHLIFRRATDVSDAIDFGKPIFEFNACGDAFQITFGKGLFKTTWYNFFIR